MTGVDDLTGCSLGALVDQIGSAEPAPGGGAAGAAALALAAACAVKTITISLKRRPEDPELTGAARRLGEIGREALHGGADDGHAFEALMAAYHLPKASDLEIEARRSEIRRRALAAAAVGERLRDLAAEVEGLVSSVGPRISPNMINDVRAAQALAEAAIHIHSDNIASNLRIAG
jgi:formiminotetrahydrofolate cyclodeaminase